MDSGITSTECYNASAATILIRETLYGLPAPKMCAGMQKTALGKAGRGPAGCVNVEQLNTQELLRKFVCHAAKGFLGSGPSSQRRIKIKRKRLERKSYGLQCRLAVFCWSSRHRFLRLPPSYLCTWPTTDNRYIESVIDRSVILILVF